MLSGKLSFASNLVMTCNNSEIIKNKRIYSLIIQDDCWNPNILRIQINSIYSIVFSPIPS